MLAHGRKEGVGAGSRPVTASIRVDKIVIILADRRIVRGGGGGGREVAVIAGGGYKVRLPALDKGGNRLFLPLPGTIVADDGEVGGDGRRPAGLEWLEDKPR